MLLISSESSASGGLPDAGEGHGKGHAGEDHPGAGAAQGRKQWPGPRLSSPTPSPDPEIFKALTFQSQKVYKSISAIDGPPLLNNFVFVYKSSLGNDHS